MRIAFFYTLKESEETIVGKVASIFRENGWDVSGAACDSKRQNILSFIELTMINSAGLFIGLSASNDEKDTQLVRHAFEEAQKRNVPAILLIETDKIENTGFKETNVFYFQKAQFESSILALTDYRNRIQKMLADYDNVFLDKTQLAWVLAGGVPAKIVQWVSETAPTKAAVLAL